MPWLEYDDALVQEFLKVLESRAPARRQKEQVVQDFLEQHTELVPTPNLLNHHLALNSIISKFRLSTSLITDYIYLTKSSGLWKITFVELETPDKAIFTADMRRATATAAFNNALDQVVDWKTYLDEHKNEILERLRPLIVPIGMRENPVTFEYQLIIGRSDNKNRSPKRLKYLEHIRQGLGIEVYSYDTLLGFYTHGQRYRKNVMRAEGDRFAFKYMLPYVPHIFAHVGPADLSLTTEQGAELIKRGYEIEKWKSGEFLTVNGKLAASSDRPFGISPLGRPKLAAMPPDVGEDGETEPTAS
ncbi:Shedu anti-phage system protein SduA domain-containing protein [Mesorhizobium sp. B263B2A]|uniref:Shedu anti-phage system protein SduA domain-containing protein n=1 Tax=Mesorhizobium sp. B263B2A TaxID=2876669 RepID=UPI001CD0FAFF|nr:Shedu anti-phage system protein SduA domain-containing protein [Mesorhizobium sp. B263B2A]MCA0031292.1 DUF4263 domain-containing protein [Mesorhizobium sp. B263B2A]